MDLQLFHIYQRHSSVHAKPALLKWYVWKPAIDIGLMPNDQTNSERRIMYNECRGCKLYRYDTPECCCKVRIPRHKDDIKCPCIECIVKPICTDVCHHLIDYIKLFYRNDTGFRFRVYLIKEIRGQ